MESDLFLVFEKCISLVSIPDISNWDFCGPKSENIFYECVLLLNLPDIVNWNKEDEKENLDRLNNAKEFFLNFSTDIIIDPLTSDNLNNYEIIDEQLNYKLERFLK